MINKVQGLRIIQKGLLTGADYAEIFIEDKTTYSINVENGKVETSAINTTYGAGVRLLNKYQSVYGYTNEVNEKSLTELIVSLSKSFNEKQCVFVDKLTKKTAKNLSISEIPFSKVSDEEIINYLKSGEEVMRKFDKRIMRTTASFMHQFSKIQIINSKGFFISDEKERARCAISCVAADNGKIETGFNGPGASAGFEFFLKNVDIKKLAKEHLGENAPLNSQRPKNKHLSQMNDSGVFAYTREIAYLSTESFTADRLKRLLLSISSTQFVLRHLPHLIADDLTAFFTFVDQTYGDESFDVSFSYHVRLGIKDERQ